MASAANAVRSPTVTLASALVVLVVGILVYANSLSNQFVWDDETLVVANRLIRNSTYLADAFTTDLAQEQEASAVYYRPVQTLSYMVDYAIWGLNPAGYHLTNLLLHLACALLVWQFFARLGLPPGPALGGALLFVVHPVNANAVAYVAGRADMLALAALLTALLLWIQYDQTPAPATRSRAILFVGSAGAFTVALFSRENALLFPVLLGLYAWLFGRAGPVAWKRTLRAVGPFLVLLVAFWLWRSAVVELQGRELAPAPALGLGIRLQVALRAMATYAGLLVWPAHLQMDRQLIWGGPQLHWLTAGGLLVVTVATGLARWSRRHDRVAFLGCCWLGITLLPVSGLLSLTASVAEHWLYLPAIGGYLAVASLARRLPARPWLTAVGAVVVLAGLGTRTVARNRDWVDATHLFAQTARAAPESVRARNNLGFTLRGAGQLTEAQRVLEEAENLNPNDLTIKANLAVLYQQQGDSEGALRENAACLRLDPRNVGTLLRLADIYDQRGRYQRARHHYLAALAVTQSLRPRALLVAFLLRHRQDREALRVARATCDLDPGNAEAYLLLATTLVRTGQTDLARQAWELAAQLDRHHPVPPAELGRLAGRRGELNSAARWYQRAVQLAADDPLLHYELGEVQARQGRWAEAEAEFRAALRLAPGSQRAQTALAAALHAQGKPPVR